MKRLRMAFSKKETAERLLAKLKEVSAEKGVGDPQLQGMKREYEELLAQGEAEINEIRADLSKRIAPLRRDQEIRAQELKNLEARFRVGEIQTAEYQRDERRLKSKLEGVERRLSETEELIAATSAADAGGFVPIRIRRPPAPSTRVRPSRTAAGGLARQLQEALSRKQKAKNLASNLEKLREQKSVDDDQYESLKPRYANAEKEASTAVRALREELKAKLERAERDIEILHQEKENLQIRFQVGQITADAYRRAERKAEAKLEAERASATELEKLAKARGTEDVGGFIDVPIDSSSHGLRPHRRDRTSAPSKPSAGRTRLPRSIDVPSFALIGSLDEVAFPRAKLVGAFMAILLFVSVLLTWEITTLAGIGLAYPVSAIPGGGAIQAIGILAAILSVLASFLQSPRASGWIHLSAGVLVLVVMLPIWFTQPSLSAAGDFSTGYSTDYWEGEDVWNGFQEMMTSGTTLREGFFLYILAALGMLVSGICQVRSE
jgi:hypothetical protein